MRDWIMLGAHPAGATIVVEEIWRGRCFAAAPHTVVESDDTRLVTWLPSGTRSVVASNVGLPEAAGLDRESRKLVAMQSMRAWPREISETPDKLHVYQAGRWSRVNLGWDPSDRRFLGWYVNFERPATVTEHGVVSKDLVLDAFVMPDGTWRWKDREDFDRAMTMELFEPGLGDVLAAEWELVLADIAARRAAFDPRWRELDPADMAVPAGLPQRYTPAGDAWSWALPPPAAATGQDPVSS